MQITLSDQTAALARQRAEASGYGTDVEAFVSNLIAAMLADSSSGVPSPRTHEELVGLLQEGLDSGISDRSWDDMMNDIRNRLAARMQADPQ